MILSAFDIQPELRWRREVELRDLEQRSRDPERGGGRVESLGEPGSFRVTCCEVELFRAEGAAETLWSYHLRHAWGGTAHHCPRCAHVYAYAGLVSDPQAGAIDVVDLGAVDVSSPRYLELDAIECHLLDTALERDHAVWLRSIDDVRQAQTLAKRADACARPALAEQYRARATVAGTQALLLRQGLQKRKAITLALLARERGYSDGWPQGARVFRDLAGRGFVKLP